jgi:hypothetical protein
MTPEEAYRSIIEACSALGWTVAMNNEDEDADIEYLIIGMGPVVDKLVEKIES